MWLIGGVGLLAAILVTSSVVRSETIGKAWVRFTVWLLRIAAVALLVVILLNPVQPDVAGSPARDMLNVLLVDTSQSMGLERPDSRLQQALDWIREVEQSTPKGQTSRVAGFGEEVNFSNADQVKGASTRMAHALRRVLDSNPGQRLANIIVVSDGRIHDRDALGGALDMARQRRVAISTHAVGRAEAPRNVFISACRVERSAPSGAMIPAQVEVGATGVADGLELVLTLKDDGGKVLASGPVTVRGSTAERTLVFPAGLRTSACTVSVTRLDGELTHADNDFTFTLEIADPKIRVLYCEGSTDRITEMNGELWNSSELFPTAWKRAGDIEADTFATRGGQRIAGRTLTLIKQWRDHNIVWHDRQGLPDTREGWHSYDVIISADVQRANFTEDQLKWVVELVAERGGGFCMIGGMTSFDVGQWQQTIWERLVPVQMAEYGYGHKWIRTIPKFPELARKHPILQLDADPLKSNRILEVHPVLLGLHDIRRAKPGATVLAFREGSNAPLIVTQPYGKGRTMAFLSDPTGGWGEEYQGVWGPALIPGAEKEASKDARPQMPNEYYNRFWTNSVRWLAGNSVRRWHKELLGRTDAITYRPGKTVKVAASLPGISDPEEVPRQSVGARIALDAQPRVPLRFDRDRKEFVGELTLPDTIQGSEVTIVFDSPGKDKSRFDEVRLRVMHIDKEMENPLPDPQLLAEIATVSGGQVLGTPGEAVALLAKTQRAAMKESIPFTRPMWDRTALWAAILGLLALEWLLRRTASA